MNENTDPMIYRKGVQVYIINEESKFLLVSSIKNPTYWKVPAGGLIEPETLIECVNREMMEELNIKVKILAKSKITHQFLWPKDLIEKHGFRYKGQEQHIFIAKIPKNEQIRINPEEIYGFRWVLISELEQNFSFEQQKETLKKVLIEFDNFKEFISKK